MSVAPSNIYITGGLGYVGGRCSRFLAGRGHHLSIGTRRYKELPAPNWLKNGRLSYYSTDLTKEDLTEQLGGVDVVIHLASPNEIVSGANPELAVSQNCIGTLRLCQAALAAGVKKFIFFSTAHVYGSPLEGTFHEELIPNPKHPYAYSHLAAEHIAMAFAGPKALPQCTVIRLTNSFGAPERLDVDRWTLLVNDLCKQAILNKKLILNSDGMGYRDFVCMSDVERAVEHLVNFKSDNEVEVFNVGCGKSMKVLEMAELVSDEAQKIFKQEIPIARRLPSTPVSSGKELEISVAKLAATGFTWENDVRKEIRETLQSCLGFSA